MQPLEIQALAVDPLNIPAVLILLLVIYQLQSSNKQMQFEGEQRRCISYTSYIHNMYKNIKHQYCILTCPSLIISNINGISTTIDVVATTNPTLPAILAATQPFSFMNNPPA